MTDKPLTTLKNHNDRRRAIANDWRNPRRNGIACPQCGAELFDSTPGVCLTSLPAQTYVHCEACDYRGMRVL
jgi:DNA-directed RNA polymerase subunit RPC12/RpoP